MVLMQRQSAKRRLVIGWQWDGSMALAFIIFYVIILSI
jgi:hypothetical protein